MKKSKTEVAEVTEVGEVTEATKVAEEETAATPETAVTPAPNIQFVGKRMINGKKVAGIAPESISDGSVIYEMPPADVQSQPFYHPDAIRIRDLFPKLYKEPVSKGESK